MFLETVNICSVILYLILTEVQLQHKDQGCSFVLTKTVDEDWNCQLHQQSSQSVLDSYSQQYPYLLNSITFVQN